MTRILAILIGSSIFLLAQAAVQAQPGSSVVTGQGLERQLDGSIDDSDDSTAQAGKYSSNGVTDSQIDGISWADSYAPNFQTLSGEVNIEIVPQSQGPFSGTPAGVSNQKVKSKFKLEQDKEVKFTLKPGFLITVDSGAQVVVRLALWVLDGSQETAMPGSVYTASYTFTESLIRPDDYDVAISRSNEQPTTGSGEDGVLIHDPSLKPDPFKLSAGDYIVQYELSIQINGDTADSSAYVNGSFDLVEVP